MMIILAILKILISCAANIDFPFSMQPTDDRLSIRDDDYGNDDHDENYDHNHVKDNNISHNT